jgi:hypothetical protein
MATPSKTANNSLIVWQDVATAAVVIGTALDVSGKFGATAFIFIGRESATAFTANWPNVRIEASAKTSGTDAWIPLVSYQPAVGSSVANTTLNGAVSAGATSFVVTAATNIAVGDVLFLKDSSTANYEIVRVKAVSGTTITPEEAVTYSHANGSQVTDQAEVYIAQFDLTSISRIRAVIDAATSGVSFAVQVLAVTYDSVG